MKSKRVPKTFLIDCFNLLSFKYILYSNKDYGNHIDENDQENNDYDDNLFLINVLAKECLFKKTCFCRRLPSTLMFHSKFTLGCRAGK